MQKNETKQNGQNVHLPCWLEGGRKVERERERGGGGSWRRYAIVCAHVCKMCVSVEGCVFEDKHGD
jgi:hypothetical protein